MSAYYYRMRAKDYYGPHAAGSVVICDGAVLFHGSDSDVRDMMNRIQQRQTKACSKHSKTK